MNIKHLFPALALLPSAHAAAQTTAKAAQDATRPNVIVILADDMGIGDIAAFNPASRISTPTLDGLCRRGMIFTDAHSSSSLSTPSRYSIITGRYPWRTAMKEGVLNGYSPAMIPQGRSTIAEMFSRAGYATACIGKWHLGWDWAKLPGETKGKGKKNENVDFSKPVANGPADRGFDYFYGISASLDMPPYVYVENRMPTSVPNRTAEAMDGLRLFRSGPQGADFEVEDCLPNQIRRSIGYIESRKDNAQPFFLYMPLTAPHTPILPSAEFQGRTQIGPYGDFVQMLDDLLGGIVDALGRTGQLDNTIIVFTSDNGPAKAAGQEDLMSRGHYPSYIYRGMKRDIFDGGHRIPFIVSWGDRFSGTKNNSLVSLTDLYATFAEMTGQKPAAGQAEDSYSIWGLLEGKRKAARPDLIAVSGFGYFSYRTPQYKLIFCAGSGGDSYPATAEQMEGLPALQLYDMVKDPSERTNLIGERKYKALVAEMTAAARGQVSAGRSTPGPRQQNDTPDDWEQLKNLGM